MATLYYFTSYANGIHGVELSIIGHIRLVGFKVADNVKNGIEIIETRGDWGGPKIQVRDINESHLYLVSYWVIRYS